MTQGVGAALPERVLQVLADHLADLTYVANQDRQVIWVGTNCADVLGWEPEEMLGTGFLDFMHPHDVAKIVAYRERLYRGEELPEAEEPSIVRLRHKDGSYHWFSGRAIPLLDDDGQPAGFAAGLRCVDDFVEEQERAQRSEREVAMVLDGMLDPHMLLGAVRDDSGEVVDVTFLRLNPEACRVLMVRAEGLIGRNLLAWQPGMVTTGIWQAGLRLWSTGEPMVLDDYQFPGEVLPGEHYFDIRGVRLGDDLLSCAFRDVTNRHQVALKTMESERRFRLLAENTTDVVVTVSAQGRVDWASPAVRSTLGVPVDSLLGRRFSDLVHPEDRELLDQSQGAEVRVGVDESWRWMRLSRRILVGDGSVTVYTAQDIQAEMETRAQLAHELGHDPLTGLSNRTAMLSRLRDLLRARSRRESLALFAIGIDDLRSLNEAFSYSAGDRVLTQIARRLLQFAKTPDDVSRVADNALTLIVHDVEDVAALADLASGLQSELPSAVTIDGHQIRLSVSIGIATPDSMRALDLLRDATSALHHARTKGGNRWEYLDSADTQAARERLIIRSGIHDALAGEQFRPWFQPVVSLTDGEMIGYEALARWVRDDGEVVMPNAFIPVAENTDLIVALDRHILRKAMAEVAALEWPAQVGINVSAQSLSEPDFADSVQDELERSGLDPALLHLEVTETALLRPTEHVHRTMLDVAELGVTWWVDDFGTGYSSITHIRDLPVQGLKLDLSFTSGLPHDLRSVRLAQGLMGLATGLGMRTTAEGVETPEQAQVLAEQGWEWGQGWLYGRPGPFA